MSFNGSRHTILTADGTTIAYFDTEGGGDPVVYLHGLAGSAVEFYPSAAVTPRHRSILVDLRGHGRSSRRPRDLSRAAFVADVVQIIEAVGGPVALVGHSMGAHTAMIVAASRPDLVNRLLLLESGAGSGTDREHQAMGKYFASWPTPFADRAAARSFLGDGALQQAWATDLEERADGLYPRFDADIMVRAIREVAVPRWQEWESITCPITVLYGSRGIFEESERREFIVRNQLARRIDLPGAGHDAHLDSPEAWRAALRSFLDYDH